MENTTDKYIREMQSKRQQQIYNSFEKAQTTDAQDEKVAKVMREFKDGKLKDSHGNVVTSRDQALAIALSQSEQIKKAEDTLDELEKARNTAQIGELREFGGRQYIKTINGWKFHGKGGGAKAQSHRSAAEQHNKSQSSTDIARKINENPSEAAHELANTPELRADMMTRVNVELNRRGQAVYTTKDHEQALSNALSAMNHEGKFNTSSGTQSTMGTRDETTEERVQRMAEQRSQRNAPKYGQTGYSPASKEQLIADVQQNYRRSSLAVQNAKVKEAIAKYFPENAASNSTTSSSQTLPQNKLQTLRDHISNGAEVVRSIQSNPTQRGDVEGQTSTTNKAKRYIAKIVEDYGIDALNSSLDNSEKDDLKLFLRSNSVYVNNNRLQPDQIQSQAKNASNSNAKSASDFIDSLPAEGSFKVKKNGKLSNATYTKESFKQSLKDANVDPNSKDHGFEGFEKVAGKSSEKFDHKQFLDHPFTGQTADESRVMAKMDALVDQGKLKKTRVKSGPNTYTKYSEVADTTQAASSSKEVTNTSKIPGGDKIMARGIGGYRDKMINMPSFTAFGDVSKFGDIKEKLKQLSIAGRSEYFNVVEQSLKEDSRKASGYAKLSDTDRNAALRQVNTLRGQYVGDTTAKSGNTTITIDSSGNTKINGTVVQVDDNSGFVKLGGGGRTSGRGGLYGAGHFDGQLQGSGYVSAMKVFSGAMQDGKSIKDAVKAVSEHRSESIRNRSAALFQHLGLTSLTR